jgi:tetratricopeptide (TPR) repeat protein
MCGGSLDVAAGETIIECEYCGTQQTLPKTTDENIQALFNRANLLRQKNEFDKAEAIYEKIIEAEETEAEAYWGVILCKFGIEYVEDPKTYKRIPTCHRTSYDSIVADEYYKKALEYADITQRTIYEVEAKKIDKIQKGILAISAQEEPYDVFICYKETDENGKRTQDSVIANDIYYQLTEEGFKVFYAAITLEDKLGSAYEPVIFAALNSSKVLLSIGTKPEYFNAVWVKNEWSRFLKMMKNDRSKMLIPCYKGMDAYELPEEFAHLQAQDMGKIGFINDLVRGIKKVVKKEEINVTSAQKETLGVSNYNVEALIKRAKMFLSDGSWDDARAYGEKILDFEPENSEAWIIKMFADLEVRNLDEIKTKSIFVIVNNSSYDKAIRFSDSSTKSFFDELLKRSAEQEVTGKFLTDSKLDTKDKLIIPNGYIVNGGTFSQCQNLKTIDVMPNNTKYTSIDGVLYSKDRSELIRWPCGKADTIVTLPKELTSIGRSAFFNCNNLTRITINEGVIEINEYAFCSCKKLESVILPSSVKNIGVRAFFYSDKLKSINIPNDAKNIGDGAFYQCKSLTNINIPDALKSIGNEVFCGCESLETINLPNSITSIGNDAYSGCVNLSSINIPDSVSRIGNNAFSRCKNLASISIPNYLIKNWRKVFESDHVVNVTILDGVTSVEKDSFSFCDKLQCVTLPNSVTTIGESAFSYCKSLHSINIPNSVTTIGDKAFMGCEKLNKISAPPNVLIAMLNESKTYADTTISAICTSLLRTEEGKNLLIKSNYSGICVTASQCFKENISTLKSFPNVKHVYRHILEIEGDEFVVFENWQSTWGIRTSYKLWNIKKITSKKTRDENGLFQIEVSITGTDDKNHYAPISSTFHCSGSEAKEIKSTLDTLISRIKLIGNTFCEVDLSGFDGYKGCYIATCVYGSYDCPQVWTLRRYRDNTLASSWYGRLFIRTYYRVSPTLVKLFGNTKWFKKMWKGRLDRMVKKLQDSGVESTPYNDKNWN